MLGRLRRLCAVLAGIALLVGAMTSQRAGADVVVVDNRTSQPIDTVLQLGHTLPQRLRLEPGVCRPLFCDEAPTLVFVQQGQQVRKQLRLQSAYFFANDEQARLQFVQIGLGDESKPVVERPLPGQPQGPAVVIPVVILVDDEETARQAVWERRLRARVEAASKIVEAHTGVQFMVVAARQWQTDDSNTDFEATLRAFEQQVDPAPGRLAIGFSSQYELVKGRVHLGGTRGPLKSHILMREWSQHVSENERMELLVHELGHLLGAAHSPEQTSVMRPVLGDRQARRVDFTVRFDPVNTLVMSMVGEELRRRRIDNFASLSAPTKLRLKQIYGALGPTQPDDRTAASLAAHLGAIAVAKNPQQPQQQATRSDPESQATLRVMSAVVTAARQNKQGSSPLAGDELFDLYLTTALDAAASLPPQRRCEHALAGLILALDTTGEMSIAPEIRKLANRVDSEGARTVRRAFIGRPTAVGRADVPKHFLLSGYLALKRSESDARGLGIAKELADARPGGSGFSFSDVAVDLAGIRFARYLVEQSDNLARNANWSAQDFLPPLAGLRDGISLDVLLAEFGGPDDPRLQKEIDRLQQSVDSLQVYQANTATTVNDE